MMGEDVILVNLPRRQGGEAERKAEAGRRTGGETPLFFIFIE